MNLAARHSNEPAGVRLWATKRRAAFKGTRKNEARKRTRCGPSRPGRARQAQRQAYRRREVRPGIGGASDTMGEDPRDEMSIQNEIKARIHKLNWV